MSLIGCRKIPIISGGGLSLLQQVIALSPTGLYDISQLNTLYSDRSATPSTPASVDGVVGTILDLSGNANHAIAPSDAARGILNQSGLFYYIDFDGVNDCYEYDGDQLIGNPYTIVSLSALNQTPPKEFFIIGGTQTSSANIRLIFGWGGGGSVLTLSQFSNDLNVAQTQDNNLHILSGLLTSSGHRIRKNKTQIASNANTTGITANVGSAIGRGAGFFAPMNFYRLAIYNKELSSDELDIVESWVGEPQ